MKTKTATHRVVKDGAGWMSARERLTCVPCVNKQETFVGATLVCHPYLNGIDWEQELPLWTLAVLEWLCDHPDEEFALNHGITIEA